MWPDERELTHDLAVAGAAARERLGTDAMPGMAFGTDLRRRLVAQIPSVAQPVRRSWSFADLFRGRRLAPILAGGLLSIAVGAVAGA
ncbi:MAG: hypothetical protein M3Y29_05200, partial [Chloroflexota bacterium]|nr:hypothetical protein [Chloroflexota bacterium]